MPFAIVAALLLWLPYAFFAGSFMEQSFLSQVVSELFAVAMWWALVAWSGQPVGAALMALFALFGVAAFLTWPIWIGPLVLTLVLVVMHAARASRPATPRRIWRSRCIPIAIVTAIYASTRQVYGFHMVNAVGFAIWPTPRTLGWPFVVAGRRRHRLGGVRSTRAERRAAGRRHRAAGRGADRHRPQHRRGRAVSVAEDGLSRDLSAVGRGGGDDRPRLARAASSRGRVALRLAPAS